MPKLLQINPVLRLSTSTGRIMREIGETAMEHGWESYVAYSQGRDGVMECTSQIIPVGNKVDVAMHALGTRILDRHGLCSKCSTEKFVEQIVSRDPDIIHIHNIHGYFLNYKILFDYLRDSNKKVVWTVHDCWLYTGHCYHYASANCQKWQTGCQKCEQKGKFPASWFVDRSEKNYRDKKAAFTSLSRDNFVIVPVSEWMRKEMSASFLRDCKIQVIHNGIDLEKFRPVKSDILREKYGVTERVVYLGVASIWVKEKGLNDLIKMAQLLGGEERIVIVGKIPKKGIKFPDKITHIPCTEDVNELVELYSCSTVLLNPTWQDNYPTVNLEATACGCPVVSYRTGGSPETIDFCTGKIVDQGSVEQMFHAAREISKKNREDIRNKCVEYARQNFSKKDRYKDYIDLYLSML